MIIGINGHLRQGKGILATYLSLVGISKGAYVKSNYKINHPHAEEISFYDLVSLINKPRATVPTIINIDEIYGWLESRISSSKANRFASYFVFQSAKKGYDIIYTSQLTMRVDCTLRELCDMRIYAQKDVENKQFNYYLLDTTKPNEDVLTGDSFSITFEQAKNFWNFYDTYEGVSPVGMNEFLVEIEKYDYKRASETIDRQCTLVFQLLTEEQAVSINKIAVEDALLRLGEPSTFSALVLHRVLKKRLKLKSTQETQIEGRIEEEKQSVESYRQKWLSVKKEKGI